MKSILFLFGFSLFTLFLCGCSEPPAHVIYSIQGRGPNENEAVVKVFGDVNYVIGKGFGTQPGRLMIGDREISIQSWDDHRIAFRLTINNLSFGQVTVFARDGEDEIEILGPELIPDGNIDGERPLYNAFREYIQTYAEENGLIDHPDFPGWVDWMLSDEGDQAIRLYSKAYQRQLVERVNDSVKHVRVSYTYKNNLPLRLLEPWVEIPDREELEPGAWENAQEAMHMLKVKELLDATYPSYRFEVIKDLDPHLADITVISNVVRNGGVTYGPTVGLEYSRIETGTDQTLPHEMAHFLMGWNSHHCGFQCQLPPGEHMPPTTLPTPQKCTMDHDWGYWCNACAAAMGIPLDQLNEAHFERYQAIADEFLQRYEVVRQ